MSGGTITLVGIVGRWDRTCPTFKKTTMHPTHYVKCREKGQKAWHFITSKGATTRLRVHAARFMADRVQETIKEFMNDNPEWEFKAMTIPVKR